MTEQPDDDGIEYTDVQRVSGDQVPPAPPPSPTPTPTPKPPTKGG